MKEPLTIAKALADASRLKSLFCLREGELCLCQIVILLGLAPATVSKHMAILYQAGLVETRKSGRWVYYRLPKASSPCARGALSWIARSLPKGKTQIVDEKKLRKVRGTPQVALCRYYQTLAHNLLKSAKT
ncbi:MAG: winged helix-turn-helix transcriptional regulator [Verrucomicrobia bacterium]|nr:winged helix-turn-helix transcriptional regulator [Verrucomicrobiota bacterium]